MERVSPKSLNKRFWVGDFAQNLLTRDVGPSQPEALEKWFANPLWHQNLFKRSLGLVTKGPVGPSLAEGLGAAILAPFSRFHGVVHLDVRHVFPVGFLCDTCTRPLAILHTTFAPQVGHL